MPNPDGWHASNHTHDPDEPSWMTEARRYAAERGIEVHEVFYPERGVLLDTERSVLPGPHTHRVTDDHARAAVRALLHDIGEDPARDGLVDTPRRVVKALRELTAGYGVDIASILTTTFDVEYDGLVVVSRIPFHSLCEHHMLPFTGHATVGYVPRDRVVGLSRLAGLVDAYARRLQVQERMTTQIADALDEHLAPLAAGVIITANHTCMSMRGIQRHAEMRTSSLRGTLDTDTDLRHEFLALHGQ